MIYILIPNCLWAAMVNIEGPFRGLSTSAQGSYLGKGKDEAVLGIVTVM